jgi:hypothetical protein
MPISITEVKSSRLSDDKKEVMISGKGKYIGELELLIAHECLDDFIAALVRGKAALGSSAEASLAAVAPATPASALNGGGAHAAPLANPDEITAALPKNFMVTADPKGRGLVMMVIDHRLANQRGYALPPDAAKQLAVRLTSSADAVLAAKPLRDPPRTLQA